MISAEPQDDAGPRLGHGPDGGEALAVVPIHVQIGVVARDAQPPGQPLADLLAAASVFSTDGDDHPAPPFVKFLTIAV